MATITRQSDLTVVDDQIVRRLLAEIVTSITGVPVYMPTQRVRDESSVFGRVRVATVGEGGTERMQRGEDRQPVRVVVHVQQQGLTGADTELGAAALHHAAARVRLGLTGVTAIDSRAEGTHTLQMMRCSSQDLLDETFEPVGAIELVAHGIAIRDAGQGMIAAGSA